ncbi:MAG: HEAT repeat domain-containing protein [Planctomycetota bacterium]|nr:HEAT repeat domain-containing protein [Planctomycetota bacterium]
MVVVLALATALGTAGETAGQRDSEVVQILVQALEYDHPDVKECALRHLSEMGPKAKAAAPQLRLLVESDPKFREKALIALAKTCEPVLPAASKLLADEKTPNRLTLLQQIAKMAGADKGLAPLYIQLLRDRDYSVRRAAIAGLKALDIDPTPHLLPLLKEKDSLLRTQIVEELRAPAGLPALIAALKDEEPSVRLHAVLAIGRIGADAAPAVGALRETLREQRAGGIVLGPSAATSLGQIGPPAKAALPDLQPLAASTDPSTRASAAMAIWRIGGDPGTALPVLKELLQKPAAGSGGDSSAALSALHAVSEIGAAAKEAIPLVGEVLTGPAHADVRSMDIRVVAVQTMGKMGPGAVPYLTQGLSDKSEVVVRLCAEALAQIGAGASTAAPQLLALLKRQVTDAHTNQGPEVAAALAKLDGLPKTAIPDLASIIKTVKGVYAEQIKLAAASALSRQGAAAKAELLECLKYTSGEAQDVLAQAVGKCGLEVLPELLKLYKPDAPSPDRRTGWLKAIAAIGPPVVEPLIKLLGDPDRDMQQAAHLCLSKLPCCAPEVIKVFKTSPDAKLARSAFIVLLTLGEKAPEAPPVVLEEARNPASKYRQMAISGLPQCGEAAKKAVPDLLVATKDRDPATRAAATSAFMNMKVDPETAVPVLRERLKDISNQVRARAVWTLGTFGPAAVPALMDALSDLDPGVRADAARTLAQLSPWSLPDLVRAIKGQSEERRKAALECLVAVGPLACPALVPLIKDDDAAVRTAAAEALTRLGAVAVPGLLKAAQGKK